MSVSFATKLNESFLTKVPFVACDVPNSKPVKIKVNNAASHNPNNVREVALLNFLTLLDRIRNPRINNSKNGIPTIMNTAMVNNQIGNVEL